MKHIETEIFRRIANHAKDIGILMVVNSLDWEDIAKDTLVIYGDCVSDLYHEKPSVGYFADLSFTNGSNAVFGVYNAGRTSETMTGISYYKYCIPAAILKERNL